MTTNPGPGLETHDDRSIPADDPAARALAEAEARRSARDLAAAPPPPEIDGRPGLEPVRYGDWENKGIASDF